MIAHMVGLSQEPAVHPTVWLDAKTIQRNKYDHSTILLYVSPYIYVWNEN